jgi:hypothetical protein
MLDPGKLARCIEGGHCTDGRAALDELARIAAAIDALTEKRGRIFRSRQDRHSRIAPASGSGAGQFTVSDRGRGRKRIAAAVATRRATWLMDANRLRRGRFARQFDMRHAVAYCRSACEEPGTPSSAYDQARMIQRYANLDGDIALT